MVRAPLLKLKVISKKYGCTNPATRAELTNPSLVDSTSSSLRLDGLPFSVLLETTPLRNGTHLMLSQEEPNLWVSPMTLRPKLISSSSTSVLDLSYRLLNPLRLRLSLPRLLDASTDLELVSSIPRPPRLKPKLLLLTVNSEPLLLAIKRKSLTVLSGAT